MLPALANPVFKESRPYAAEFARFAAREGQRWPKWLQITRQSGLSRVLELGLPTPDQEEWRYTDTSAIAETPFHPVLEARRHGVTESVVKRYIPKDSTAHWLVFIDGHYCPEFSRVGAKPETARLGSLATAITLHADKVEYYSTHENRTFDHAFAALNAAFFQDGAFIWIPPGVEMAEPVHLLFLATGHAPTPTYHPRNLIIAQKRSRVKIVECYCGLGSQAYLTNCVTEVFVHDAAAVEHVLIQDESRQAFHVHTLQAHLHRDSQYRSHAVSVGARLSRRNLRVLMAEERGDCLLNGLYLADQDQLTDHHTIVDHARAHCQSHEFYHGILGGQAKGVFSGKILVRKDAQKTNAKQTNRNLLLSEKARIDTKPQLEIFADDVKCTHAATVGQLDEDRVFYLRARGLDLEEARAMLIHAFASEILDRISIPEVRWRVDQLVLERLSQFTRTQGAP